jgi:hypothetical protein
VIPGAPVPRLAAGDADEPGTADELVVATGVSGAVLYRSIVASTRHLWVIDASDPYALETITTIDLGGAAGGAIEVDGSLLYVVVTDGVRVFDISVPSAPVALTTIATPQLNGVRILGTEMWGFAPQELHAYDVTDPFAATLISMTPAPVDTTQPGPTTTFLEALWAFPERPDRLLARVRETNPWFGTGWSVDHIDVSNPAAPVFGSTALALGYDGEFGGSGGVSIANATMVAGGIILFDGSGQSAVLRTASTTVPGSGSLSLAYNASASGLGFLAPTTLLWSANEGSGWSLVEVDASIPSAPTRTATIPVPFSMGSFTDVGGGVYVSTIAGDHIGIDPSDPEFLDPVGVAPYPSGNGIAVDGSLVASLVPVGTALRLTDFSDPSVPVALGSVLLPGGGLNAVEVGGTTAYVSRVGGFDVVDVTDPMLPAVVGSASLASPAHGFRVSGTIAHVATDLGYLALSLANPASPSQFGNLPMSFPAHDVDVWNGRPLVAREDAAGGALDMLTPPPGPSLQFSFPVNGIAHAVVARDGLAFVAADGLYVIQLPGGGVPPPPVLVSHLPLGQCVSLSLDGDVAYLATASATYAVDVTDPSNPQLLGGLPEYGGPVAAIPGAGVILASAWSTNDPMAAFPGACLATGLGAPGRIGFPFEMQAGPNPFRAGTRVRFSLPQQDWVRLSAYDVSGRCVATLAEGFRGAGEHSVPWTGRDSQGRGLASGVYFLRLTAGSREETGRVVFLR